MWPRTRSSQIPQNAAGLIQRPLWLQLPPCCDWSYIGLVNNMIVSKVLHLFPRLCAVGLASTVNGALVFSEVNQRDRQTGKVGHVVVQQLSCVVHFVVKATVGHLPLHTHKPHIFFIEICFTQLLGSSGWNVNHRNGLSGAVHSHNQPNSNLYKFHISRRWWKNCLPR